MMEIKSKKLLLHFTLAMFIVQANSMPKPKNPSLADFSILPDMSVGQVARPRTFKPKLIFDLIGGVTDDITNVVGSASEEVLRSANDVTDSLRYNLLDKFDLSNEFLEQLSGSVESQISEISKTVGKTNINKIFSNLNGFSNNPPKIVKMLLNLGEQYLGKYGYVKASKASSRDKVSNIINFADAILEFQRFAGIEQTGELNPETLKFMNMSRCGVEDTIGTYSMDKRTYRANSKFVGSKRRRFRQRQRKNKKRKSRSKRYLAEGGKWKNNEITYSIKNYSPDMPNDVIDKDIKRALQLWAKVTKLKFRKLPKNEKADLQISFGSDYHGDDYPFDGKALNIWAKHSALSFKRVPSGANIEVSFVTGSHGDGYSFDGKGGTLAHAFFPEDGKTHFDDSEYFSHKGEGTNLYIVAAHEFGHALGLGHSSVPDSLMAPFYQGYVEDFDLHQDDINGIQELYGKHIDKNVERPKKTPKRPAIPSKPVKPTKKPRADIPDVCTTSFDDFLQVWESANGRTRQKTYAFKGPYYYEIDDYGVMPGYPKKINRKWSRMVGNINAAVFSPYTRKTYFFKGANVWRYSGGRLDSGFPYNLTDLGFKASFSAAFIWGGNGRIILMRKTKFYIFNERMPYDSRVNNYQREYNNEIFDGVPNGVDAALHWKNGKTYFFQGQKYWKFNDTYMTIDKHYPRSIASEWLGCKKTRTRENRIQNKKSTMKQPKKNSGKNKKSKKVTDKRVQKTNVKQSVSRKVKLARLLEASKQKNEST